MLHGPLAVFSLNSGQALAERIAGYLGTRLADHEEREFEWGQHKVRPLQTSVTPTSTSSSHCTARQT